VEVVCRWRGRAVLLGLVLIGVAADAPARPASAGQPRTQACKYEENCECAVPGITVRWKAAYCMALNQTDDLEQQGVNECLYRPDAKPLGSRTACARNEHWKRQWCGLVRKGPAAVRACVADPKMIPRIVEFGAGG
jgi:hypothetical protein